MNRGTGTCGARRRSAVNTLYSLLRGGDISEPTLRPVWLHEDPLYSKWCSRQLLVANSTGMHRLALHLLHTVHSLLLNGAYECICVNCVYTDLHVAEITLTAAVHLSLFPSKLARRVELRSLAANVAIHKCCNADAYQIKRGLPTLASRRLHNGRASNVQPSQTPHVVRLRIPRGQPDGRTSRSLARVPVVYTTLTTDSCDSSSYVRYGRSQLPSPSTRAPRVGTTTTLAIPSPHSRIKHIGAGEALAKLNTQ